MARPADGGSYQCACCGEMKHYRRGKLIAFFLSPCEVGSAVQICADCVMKETMATVNTVKEFFLERRQP